MKKKIIVLLSLAIVLATAGIAQASMATKQLSAVYQNMKIYVNGKAVSVQPDEEPFIYNGRTFVPIRVVTEALNQKVEWIGATKSVNITGTVSTPADANLLTQKDQEIQSLKLQLTQKNTEIQNLNNTIASLKKDNGDLDDLESDLLSDYEELEDVKIDDISLDGDEDQVDVDVEVDLGDYDSEWENLTDTEIEDWIDDVAGDIQDALSDDTEVSGNITDTDSDDVLVKFSKDGDSSLDVTYKDEDYRDGGSDEDANDVEDDLDGDIFDVDGLNFEITDISYYNDDDSVTVKLRTGTNNASSEWNSISSSTKDSDVIDICKEIVNTFADDANITIETVDIRFFDEDGLALDSFDYDVDNKDLN